MAEFIVISGEAIFNFTPQKLSDVLQDAYTDGVRTIHIVERDAQVEPRLEELLQKGSAHE